MPKVATWQPVDADETPFQPEIFVSLRTLATIVNMHFPTLSHLFNELFCCVN